VHDKFDVINAYPEVVREEGNKKAQALIDSYFEVGGAFWRGFGFIPDSAMVLKKEFSDLDAETQFPVEEPNVSLHQGADAQMWCLVRQTHPVALCLAKHVLCRIP